MDAHTHTAGEAAERLKCINCRTPKNSLKKKEIFHHYDWKPKMHRNLEEMRREWFVENRFETEKTEGKI